MTDDRNQRTKSVKYCNQSYEPVPIRRIETHSHTHNKNSANNSYITENSCIYLIFCCWWSFFFSISPKKNCSLFMCDAQCVALRDWCSEKMDQVWMMAVYLNDIDHISSRIIYVLLSFLIHCLKFSSDWSVFIGEFSYNNETNRATENE